MRVKANPNTFQKWCIDNGYTAQTIADMLGLSKHTIYNYFSGERLPSRKTRKRFKELFKIDPDEIFDWEC